MSNVYPFTREDQRMDQASEWIARIDRGLSAEETEAFQQWMSSPQNAEVMLEMAKLWDKMDALNKLSAMFPHEPVAQHPASRRNSWVAMAATFLLASMLSVGAYQQGLFDAYRSGQQQQVVFENTYSTSVGEHATFYLQDNTKVALNTNSMVKVTYTDKQRLFELQRGELHVTVAHNKKQPLSVHAGDKVIQAVGTAFNVELQNDDVELLVTDGKVLVADRIGEQAQPLLLEDVRLPSTSLAVIKGEKVALNDARLNIEQIANEDINADLSWQQGTLIFRGETLEDAMQEVSRYTDFTFEMKDEQVKNIQIAGLFKTGDVEGLLAALEQNFNVRYQRVGSHTIRLRLAEI